MGIQNYFTSGITFTDTVLYGRVVMIRLKKTKQEI